MYQIKTISLFYDHDFKNKIENIRTFEPEIKIITNKSNNLDIEFIETNDKFHLIEHCINKYKNTLFIGSNYTLNNKFVNFETQKDLGLFKENNQYILDCIFCENIKCISYLKSNNLKNINFIFNFLVLSKSVFLKQIQTSIFINCDNSILRQSEYLTCLNKNLDNPEISKIYYFKKEKIKDSSIIKKDLYHKLEHIEYSSNYLSYKYIFDYIKDNNIDGYKIITFPDIYFKELNLKNNFLNFKDKFKEKKIYFSLSAYNVKHDFNLGNNSHFNNIFNGLNHKAFIFEDHITLDDESIRYDNFTSLNYVTNVLNQIENNYIFNIPDLIKIYHLDNLKKEIKKKEKLEKKYLILPSMNNINFGYINFDSKDSNYLNYNNLCKYLGNYIKIVN